MIVSDIEANALLESVTKFHCGVIYDYSTAEYVSYRPSDFGACIWMRWKPRLHEAVLLCSTTVTSMTFLH